MRAVDRLHLTPQPRRHDHGEVVIAASLRDDGARGRDAVAGGAARRLVFRVPAAREGDLAEGHDALLARALFPAMAAGRPLVVHGRVSPRMLEGAGRLMRQWHEWIPSAYRPVDIEADEVAPAVGHRGPACMTFSGGLDSCHSAWRHRRGTPEGPRLDLRAGLFARGLERELVTREHFAAACRRNERILGDLGMELIPVTVNHRRVSDGGNRAWESVGATLVSIQLLFAGRFSTGLVASGAARARPQIPCPNSPITDPLLSTEAMSIVHDGDDRFRAEKAGELRGFDAALRDMRVCFHSDDQARNCGRCPKCVRTVLDFRINGLPRPPALPHDPSDAELEALTIGSTGEFISMTNIIRMAGERGLGRASWVRALRAAVHRHRRRRVVRGLGRRLAGWLPRAGAAGSAP